MKSTLALVAFYCLTGTLFAQNPALNDFYLFSPLLINPALAGRNVNPTFTQVSRIPTDGIDGSPQRYLLAYEQGIKAINSGVGAVVGHERVGLLSTWRYTLTYNYRFKFSSGNELALGGSAFHLRNNVDFTRLSSPSANPGFTGMIKSNHFGYSFGVSYSFLKNTTVGMSLINHPYTGWLAFPGSVPEGYQKRNVLVFAEQDVRLSKWLKLKPSVLFIAPGSLPAVWNLNAMADIGTWAFVGARYSNSDEPNNTSNVFAGVSFRDVARVGVTVWSKKPSALLELNRGLSFMLQVSPGKPRKETL